MFCLQSFCKKLWENYIQQRPKTFRPFVTAGRCAAYYLGMGFIFVGIGFGILFSVNHKEYAINYTNKCPLMLRDRDNRTQLCHEVVRNHSFPSISDSCKCSVKVQLNTSIEGKVFFFYGLENFYQNFRPYSWSRDDFQLAGKQDRFGSEEKLECSDDDPMYRFTNDAFGRRTPVAPCGMLADSLFNDTFVLRFQRNKSAEPETVPVISDTEIAPLSLLGTKYKNPEGSVSKIFNKTAKPASWSERFYRRNFLSPDSKGLIYEPLVVWMEIAAHQNFRKVYGRLNASEGTFRKGLPMGEYILQVDYRYPVAAFGGLKFFIMGNQTWISDFSITFPSCSFVGFGSIFLISSASMFLVHIFLYRTSVSLRTNHALQTK